MNNSIHSLRKSLTSLECALVSCFIYLSFQATSKRRARGHWSNKGSPWLCWKTLHESCVYSWIEICMHRREVKSQTRTFFIFFPNYLSFQDFHASLFCIMSLIVSSQFTIERDISVSAWCVLFPVKNISCNMPLLPSKMNIYFPAAEPGHEISHFAMRTKWLIFHKPGSFLLWHEI